MTVNRFGPADVLEAREVPDPVPGPGQVVVATAAADVIWVETMIRSGRGGEHFGFTPPYVPGGAVAGTVVSAGDGVDPGLVGRRVVARTGQDGGGYAELVLAAAANTTPVPDGLDLTVAAALATDAVTALALLDVTRVAAGDRVLVVGASGGLGIALVQLAAARGARVVATARDERKLARLAGLGAELVDSDRPDWPDRVREVLGEADVVLDNIGGELGVAAFGLTAPGARMSAHGTPSGSFTAIDEGEAAARGVTVTGIAEAQLDDDERRRRTAEAMDATVAGRLAPIVGQTFPLERAADAHRAIEERTVFGKTLLVV